jgi:hypothetical protein
MTLANQLLPGYAFEAHTVLFDKREHFAYGLAPP